MRYGSPRLNNKDDPLDELVFILLSQMTTGPSYERVFDRLKVEIPEWKHLLSMELEVLAGLISDAGLSNQKAPRLLALARELDARFGAVTLEPLRELSDEDAEAVLTSLPGVGVKTAKCVLMYAFGRDVLPVDTHVERVSRRLALVPMTSASRFAAALEAGVPPDCRYDYHVNALAHGRAVCRPLRPRCDVCPLSDLCPSADSTRMQTTTQSPSSD